MMIERSNMLPKADDLFDWHGEALHVEVGRKTVSIFIEDVNGGEIQFDATAEQAEQIGHALLEASLELTGRGF